MFSKSQVSSEVLALVTLQPRTAEIRQLSRGEPPECFCGGPAVKQQGTGSRATFQVCVQGPARGCADPDQQGAPGPESVFTAASLGRNYISGRFSATTRTSSRHPSDLLIGKSGEVPPKTNDTTLYPASPISPRENLHISGT